MQSSKRLSFQLPQRSKSFLLRFSQVILLANVLMVMTAMVSEGFPGEIKGICSFVVGGGGGRGGFSGRGL